MARQLAEELSGGPETSADQEKRRKVIERGPEAFQSLVVEDLERTIPSYQRREDGSDNLHEVLEAIAKFKASTKMQEANAFIDRLQEESKELGRSNEHEDHREKAQIDNALDYFQMFIRRDSNIRELHNRLQKSHSDSMLQ